MMDTKELIKLKLNEDVKMGHCIINDEEYTDDKTIVEAIYFTDKIPNFIWNNIKRLWITKAAYYPLRVEIDYICINDYKESLCPLEDIIFSEEYFKKESNIYKHFPENKLILSKNIYFCDYEEKENHICGIIKNFNKDFFKIINKFLIENVIYSSFNKYLLKDESEIIYFEIDTNNKYNDIMRFINAITFAANGEPYDDYLEYGLI